MSRLHKAKARAGLYGSVENRIDDELFSMFLDLAESVLHCAACTTAAEFIALEHSRP